MRKSHPGSFEINSLLQRKLGELDNFIVQNRLMQRPVTFDTIREFYFKQGEDTIFNDFTADYVRDLEGFTLNTLKVYHTFLKHLNSYNPRIKFADLSEGLLNNFKDFLQFEKGLKGGATKKYFDKFKLICKDAVKKSYLEVNQNPFYYSELKIKVEKLRRTCLEVPEIRAIKSLI